MGLQELRVNTDSYVRVWWHPFTTFHQQNKKHTHLSYTIYTGRTQRATHSGIYVSFIKQSFNFNTFSVSESIILPIILEEEKGLLHNNLFNTFLNISSVARSSISSYRWSAEVNILLWEDFAVILQKAYLSASQHTFFQLRESYWIQGAPFFSGFTITITQ